MGVISETGATMVMVTLILACALFVPSQGSTLNATNGTDEGNFTTSTDSVPTTLDPLTEMCLETEVNYVEGECYCQLDACTDAIFELEDFDWCLNCAIQATTTTEEPPPTTVLDWATLFTSDEMKDPNNTESATVETSTDATNATTTIQTTTTTIPTTGIVTTTTTGEVVNNTTTILEGNTTTTEIPTTTQLSLSSNHSRCLDIAYGVQFTNVASFAGERCCCANYPGEMIHVKVTAFAGQLQYGQHWTRSLSDQRNPKSRALRAKVAKELGWLASPALEGKITAYRFVDMYKVGFTQMGASFIVTLSQSRSGNSQMVRDAMASIFSTYAKIPESQGIFNRTFKGYTKTNYENNTIWTSRYIDLSLMPKVEATTISPDEAEGVSVGAIILLVVGLILLLAAVVYILFFSRSCFCKAWFS